MTVRIASTLPLVVERVESGETLRGHLEISVEYRGTVLTDMMPLRSVVSGFVRGFGASMQAAIDAKGLNAQAVATFREFRPPRLESMDATRFEPCDACDGEPGSDCLSCNGTGVKERAKG